jgi:cytochrome P450
MPEPSLEFDPFVSPEAEDPHPTLRRAREEAPVFFSEALQTWVVTRHADVTAVLADPVRYSSFSAISNRPAAPFAPAVMTVLERGIPYEGGMVDMDPPVHTLHRRLFNRAFTPRRLSEMNPRIELIVSELVARFARQGRGELVAEVAYPLPARVIAGVFGVPDADVDRLKLWSDEMIVIFAHRGTQAEMVEAAEGVVDFQLYIRDFLTEQLADPGDHLTGDLLRALAEMEDPPSIDTLVGVVMTVIFAGHETTTTLIGSTVRLLLQHPAVLDALRADMSLLPAVITESLRFDPPVASMYRTTTCEVRLGGVTLPEGAHLQLSFVSANRDAAVFADPDTFDVHRPRDQPILSFGRGIHYCIGAALAQAEARYAVRELVGLPGLRLAPDQELPVAQSPTVRTNEAIWLEWDT